MAEGPRGFIPADEPPAEQPAAAVKDNPASKPVEPPPSASPATRWGDLSLQLGHQGNILDFQITDDGQTLVTLATDATFIFWNTNNWGQRNSVQAGDLIKNNREKLTEDFTFEQFALSGDGRTLATNGPGNQILVWQLPDWTLAHTLAGHTETLTNLAISADGGRLASADQEGGCQISDLRTGKVLHSQKLERQPEFLCISADGKRVLYSDPEQDDAVIQVWNADNGNHEQSLHYHTETVTCAAINAAGTRAITGGDDNHAAVWDLASGEVLFELTDHVNDLTRVAISPDGLRFVTASRDESVITWNAEGAPLTVFEKHAEQLREVCLDAKNDRVLSLGDDEQLRIWKFANGEELQALRRGLGTSYFIAVDPLKRWLATSHGDGIVQVWDLASGQVRHHFSENSSGTHALAFSPDGNYLAAGDDDGRLVIWHTENWEIVESRLVDPEAINSLAFSANGQRLLGVGGDTAHVWDVNSFEISSTLTATDSTLTGSALTRDGSLAILACRGGALGWYDVNQREWRHQVEKTDDGTYSVALHSDGQQFVVGSDNHKACLWSLRECKQMAEFTGHTDSVYGVAIHPDGNVLVTSSADKTARLWNLREQKCLHTMAANEILYGITFSRDGKHIFCAGAQGTGYCWQVETGRLACRFWQLNKGADWLVVAPSGHFDGSPAARKLVMFRPANQTESFPGEEVAPAAYVPGLFAKILKGEQLP
ncbi:MAG: WD40 repeat domain-containing protein [Pirellulales bacterium]|nr:WD40 repeat domain-containing protein [Pirellulales bacterium]